jgi:transposase InsO family protein
MRTLLFFIVHLVLTLVKRSLPGGTRIIVAENLTIKLQLIVAKRKHRRCPALSPMQRLLFGFLSTMMSSRRLARTAVVISPATILKFHKALVRRKYRRIFSNKSSTRQKPGPKGPTPEVIKLILDIKSKNPTFGCPKIADMVNNIFELYIEKDVVRRVFLKHFRPDPNSNCPSSLAFIGHTKDSLWSLDLFRCESISLQTHWVLVVLDQYTRRIVGFAVHQGDVNGFVLRCMFAHIIRACPEIFI